MLDFKTPDEIIKSIKKNPTSYLRYKDYYGSFNFDINNNLLSGRLLVKLPNIESINPINIYLSDDELVTEDPELLQAKQFTEYFRQFPKTYSGTNSTDLRQTFHKVVDQVILEETHIMALMKEKATGFDETMLDCMNHPEKYLIFRDLGTNHHIYGTYEQIASGFKGHLVADISPKILAYYNHVTPDYPEKLNQRAKSITKEFKTNTHEYFGHTLNELQYNFVRTVKQFLN